MNELENLYNTSDLKHDTALVSYINREVSKRNMSFDKVPTHSPPLCQISFLSLE